MPSSYMEPGDPMKKLVASGAVVVVAAAIIVPVTIRLARGDAYKQGERAFKAGNYEEAAGRFEQSVEAGKKTTDSNVYLARLQGIQGNYSAGIELCNKALAQKPEHPKALYYKALLLQLAGRGHEAVSVLQDLADAVPSQAGPYIAGLGGFVKLQKLGPWQIDRRVEILKGTAGSKQFKPW